MRSQQETGLPRTTAPLVRLRAVCGPGDEGGPVVTVMLPDEGASCHGAGRTRVSSSASRFGASAPWATRMSPSALVLSSEEAARETAGRVASLGRRGLVVPADVSVAAGVTRLVAAVEAGLGPVDVLVNNAGVARPLPPEQLTERDADDPRRVRVR